MHNGITINEIRIYLNDKIVEATKREADNSNLSSIQGTCEFISVTLPSSKKKKLTAQSIINFLINYLDKKSSCNERLNQSFNTIEIGLTNF